MDDMLSNIEKWRNGGMPLPIEQRRGLMTIIIKFADISNVLKPWSQVRFLLLLLDVCRNQRLSMC
jgi:hypothetical protein